MIPGVDVEAELEMPGWASFLSGWDDLPPDTYLPSGDSYRSRRYGRMAARPLEGGGYSLIALADAPFQQSADVVPLYAGRARSFAAIHKATLASACLRSLLAMDLAVAAGVEGHRGPFRLGIHMIRVIVSAGQTRLPAPEGRHSDGHRYVAMHLMRREGCIGGESRIYEAESSTADLTTTLATTLDTIFVDDRRVEHEVTPIKAVGAGGVRDMLLVDFDPDVQ